MCRRFHFLEGELQLVRLFVSQMKIIMSVDVVWIKPKRSFIILYRFWMATREGVLVCIFQQGIKVVHEFISIHYSSANARRKKPPA